MSDTVFILGAGFSFDANIPLMGNFFDRMWELAIRGKNPDGSPLSSNDKRIFEAAVGIRSELNEYHGRAAFDDRNIEDILSILSFEGFARQNRRDRVSDMSRAISRTIDLTCNVKHPGYKNFHNLRIIEDGPDLYRQFWRSLYNLSDIPTIITFNYDLVLERSLLQTLVSAGPDGERPPRDSIRINHHYEPLKPPIYSFRLVPFGSGFSNTKTGFVPQPAEYDNIRTSDIEILKLHGSLNFLKKKSDAAENDNIAAVVEDPLILPPIFNKQSKIAQREIWSTALSRLRCAKNVVIVGYSLPRTDIYMQYFLKAALGPNINLNRVIIFDPALYDQDGAGAEIRKRFEECFSPQLRTRMCFKPELLGADLPRSGRVKPGSTDHFVTALRNHPQSIIFE